MADQQSSTRPGTLTLAGLPIGHRDDTTPRLRAALENAEIIAAEDTRRLRQFAARIGVRPGGERGAASSPTTTPTNGSGPRNSSPTSKPGTTCFSSPTRACPASPIPDTA